MTGSLGRKPDADRWMDPLPIPGMPDGYEAHEVEAFRGPRNRMIAISGPRENPVFGVPHTYVTIREVDGKWMEPVTRHDMTLSLAKKAVAAAEAVVSYLNSIELSNAVIDGAI